MQRVLEVFAPSWLLIFGALPHWRRLSRNRQAAAALQGANAAVAGLFDPEKQTWTPLALDEAELTLAAAGATLVRVER